MHSLRWPSRLSAAVVVLLVVGCGQEVTGPTPMTAFLSPKGSPSLSTTYLNGNVVTVTDDAAGTIAVDRANHTAAFNGETVILTQEAADSLADQFLRMYNAERAADEALNAPPPPPPSESMCDDPSVTCDVGHMVKPSLGATEDANGLNALLWKGTRKRIVTAPPTIGDIVPTDAANGVLEVDPYFTCTDVTKAIYEQMPGYRASKKALVGALMKEGTRLLNSARSLPQLPTNPTSWYSKAELYTSGPILDYLFMNYEVSRTRLNFLAIQFRIKGCYTPPSSPPPSPTSGGGSGSQPGARSGNCYWEVTYIEATGQIIDERFLGCW